jgi:alpha-ketoglutarate-dependent taurine dioxygenase
VHHPGEWSGLPLAEAVVDGADPGDWLVDHRELATDLLRRHGALLLRGFDCDEPGLERAVGRFSGGLLEYSYRSTPRSTVVGRVYTSTEYPSDQVIPLHNEMSYAARWPGLLWFLCVTPATAGGATPVASSRAVWERIPVALRERFESKGVQYRRVFGPNLDLPWQEAFQATDRAEVNAECRRQGLRYEWLDASRLVTSVVRPASIEHRATGVRVWFNQAHLFHDSTLAAGVRSALLSAVGEEGMPRSARYGDGSPVHDDDIAAIADAYAAVAVDAAWQAGDLLVMDNEAMAHGRRPFSGQRRVVVAMSEQSGGPADGT